ncbi:MAG: chorismate-binding protein, partial [Spirochaetota bacterium]
MKTLHSHIYNSYIIDPLALESMNYYGRRSIPFFFIIDFLANEPYIAPLQEVNKSILYSINGFSNCTTCTTTSPSLVFNKYPVAYLKFKEAFDAIYAHLVAGNSYLVNLTFPTPIDVNLSLYQIFLYSNALYKLYCNDQFVVFSPEPFITIKDGCIYTFPMKGTIDATIKYAKEILIHDQKEYAEHITVVD